MCHGRLAAPDLLSPFNWVVLAYGDWVALGLLLTAAVVLVWKFGNWPRETSRVLAIGTVISFVTAIALPLCILAPYEAILFGKAIRGIQAVEEGFKLDPTAQKADAQMRLSRAVEAHPGIWPIYLLGANACEKWSLLDQAVGLRYKSIMLELMEHSLQSKNNLAQAPPPVIGDDWYESQLDSERTLLRAGKYAQVDREVTNLLTNLTDDKRENQSRLYDLRARARAGQGQVDLAKSDIKAAIKLRQANKPNEY
jgi:hypothetical protein